MAKKLCENKLSWFVHVEYREDTHVGGRIPRFETGVRRKGRLRREWAGGGTVL